MALIFDNDLAICGLGMSCQTALQLDEHRAYLEELVGRPATRCSTPFDWLVCGPSSIARMIAENRFFPQSPKGFTKSPYPRWDDLQVLYLHEKNVVTNFGTASSKWQHITENFALISKARRKVFILSNTQNNLLKMGEGRLEKGWSDLTDLSVMAVRQALVKRFGPVELYCVVYADRHSLTENADLEGLHTLKRDASEVVGDQQAWRRVLWNILREHAKVFGQLAMPQVPS